MKYTIKEILPAQIKVEFEDNSWAIVPISPDATKEEIDTAVSQYDPDFLPKPEDLINKNITVGEVRDTPPVSNIETNQSTSESSEENTQENNTSKVPFDLNFPSLTVTEYYVLADYYSKKGDDRLKNALTENLEKFIAKPDFSLEELIADITYDPEDIIFQAEMELQNGI